MTLRMAGILQERLKRQGLAEPLEIQDRANEYVELFRRLQPVAPVHNSRPGEPPTLVHRTLFGDESLSFDLRAKQILVKGRFQGGRVAYVHQNDLKLYALAFRKTLDKLAPIQKEILSLIQTSGGLTKEQLKEELPFRSGDISKALQTLQEAFLVYELQTDKEWDTGWLDFSEEWFDLEDSIVEKRESQLEVVQRFIAAMVCTDETQIKSWSGWPVRTIKELVEELVSNGRLIRTDLDQVKNALILKQDAEQEWNGHPAKVVFMLDKSDFLVRAYLKELQERYKGHEVLQYLLIDGEFKGIVTGHWGFGSYDLEDIILDLDSKEARERQGEIIRAVRQIYSKEEHRLLRYQGEDLIEAL